MSASNKRRDMTSNYLSYLQDLLKYSNTGEYFSPNQIRVKHSLPSCAFSSAIDTLMIKVLDRKSKRSAKIFFIPTAAPNRSMATRLYEEAKKQQAAIKYTNVSKRSSSQKTKIGEIPATKESHNVKIEDPALAPETPKPIIRAVPDVESVCMKVDGLVLEIPVIDNKIKFVLEGKPVELCFK